MTHLSAVKINLQSLGSNKDNNIYKCLCLKISLLFLKRFYQTNKKNKCSENHLNFFVYRFKMRYLNYRGKKFKTGSSSATQSMSRNQIKAVYIMKVKIRFLLPPCRTWQKKAVVERLFFLLLYSLLSCSNLLAYNKAL